MDRFAGATNISGSVRGKYPHRWVAVGLALIVALVSGMPGGVSVHSAPSAPIASDEIRFSTCLGSNLCVDVNDTVDEIHTGPADCPVTGNGTCSLRDAVIFANANTNPAVVVFINLQPSTTYTLTIAPVSPDDATTGDLNFTNTAGAATIIQGQTGSIIDGNSTDRVVHVQSGSVSINNTTIQHGSVSGTTAFGGGALIESGANLNCSCTITNNQVSSPTGQAFGGGVYNAGSVDLYPVTLTNNTATATNGTAAGGGFYSSNGFNLRGSSVVSGNTATGATALGGGVYIDAPSGSPYIQAQSTNGISGNTAGSGGGLYLNRGSLTFLYTTVRANTATGDGGGIFVASGGSISLGLSLVIGGNTTADGNNAGGNGAGIANAGAISSFIGPMIRNNGTGAAPPTKGGGIYNTGAFSMSSGTLSNNKASTGGGLYNSAPGKTVTLSGGTISNNQATTASGVSGGGIYHAAGTMNIGSAGSPVTVSGNSAAGGDGGGIANASGATMTLMNGTVKANNATNGNGGGIANNGTLTVDSTTIGGVVSGDANIATSGNGGGIFTTGALTIQNITSIVGNVATGAGAVGWGGGIANNGGQVTVTNSAIGGATTAAGNTAYYGGGVYSTGTGATFTLNTGTVQNNTATGGTFSDGGGINNGFGSTLALTGSTVSGNNGHHGAGIATSGTATITNSTIGGNTANFPGNLGLAGGIFVNGTTTITGSTISGNQATGTSGQGGGFYLNSGPLSMTNSTVSGNSALSDGGAIFNQGTSGTLTQVTIKANSSGVANPGNLTLRNSVLANTGANCTGSGSLIDGQYNLSSDASCTTFSAANHDLIGVNPNLGPLQVNAPGTTATHALLPGSPAIDTIPNTGGCNNANVTTDQRGVARPQPSGGMCDMGAYEYIPVTPTLTALSSTSGTAAGGDAVTLSGTGFQTGTTVSFGGSAATVNTIATDGTTITVTAPSHAAGVVAVTVTNPGNLTVMRPNAFAFQPVLSSLSPASGSTAGGGTVTITGAGFAAPATVTFGDQAAANVVAVNGTTITATPPAHTAGSVAVIVTVNGQSATLPNGYTYGVVKVLPTAQPTVTGARSPTALPPTRPPIATMVSTPNPLPPHR